MLQKEERNPGGSCRICSAGTGGIEPELLSCLHDRVADVAGVEVATDDVGLALAAVEEAAGLVGQFVDRLGA
ncbi:hypothetical protein ACIRD2_34070 [Streptomyces sp. NPDC093595]|uniref:hypothetical protein n=1 Tax=Streptomyces sp. NPDC093595 TaxID=3366045 RepID=UPI003813B5C0